MTSVCCTAAAVVGCCGVLEVLGGQRIVRREGGTNIPANSVPLRLKATHLVTPQSRYSSITSGRRVCWKGSASARWLSMHQMVHEHKSCKLHLAASCSWRCAALTPRCCCSFAVWLW